MLPRVQAKQKAQGRTPRSESEGDEGAEEVFQEEGWREGGGETSRREEKVIFLHFVEAAVALGLVLMIGTQVVYPLVRGTPIFPVFRTKKTCNSLERKLRGI